MNDPRRKLPSVNTLLERENIRALMDRAPRSVVVEAVRATIEQARHSASEARDDVWWEVAILDTLHAAMRRSLRGVINATGVVLHTNLGRAPLAPVAIEAMQQAATGYTNLEYDLNEGSRGSRYSHCVDLLRELTGAEDALVVNNNAAALVLALNTFADGRNVVISRGELVEIGGSFRIPDIMERSGARLVEVGTTNRTHPSDYTNAIDASVGAIMKVHRSNFAMEGFVAEVDPRALADITRASKVPLVHDLGSGLLIPLDEIGLTGEPTAADAVRGGATLVTMSGDKLLGGPQAGIIVGAADAVRRLRDNPLLRALRVDKFTIAALEATLAIYRDPQRALHEIPILAMLGRPVSELRTRAEALAKALQGTGAAPTVVESEASVGGGAFPNARIPSVALAFSRNPEVVEVFLRTNERAPVVARIADRKLLIDLRAVQPAEDELLALALKASVGQTVIGIVRPT